MNLENIKTCELVAELEHREGAEKIEAEPHQKKKFPLKVLP